MPLGFTLLLSAVIGAGPAAPQEQELDLGERELIALSFVPAVGHLLPETRSAQMLAEADGALRTRTRLGVLAPMPLGHEVVDQCRASSGYACWVLALRGVAGRAPKDAAAGGATPRLLLLISVGPSETSTDRLSSVLVDVDRALEIYDRQSRSKPDWKEAVENEIYRRAILAETPFHDVSDADEMRVYFGRLVNEELRPVLEKTGRWTLLGSIHAAVEVSTGVARGAILRLGAPGAPAPKNLEDLPKIAVIEEGAVRVSDVAPGARIIAATKADCVPASEEARVEPKAETKVRLRLECALVAQPKPKAAEVSEETAGLLDSPWFYVGAGAVAVLAAGAIVVVAASPSENVTYHLRF